MKNKLKEVLIFTIIITYLLYSLTFNSYIKEQVIFSIDIWITKIIPALFPTFIIIDLIYNSKIPYYINKYLHIDFLYIISIISGSPSNAYILKDRTDDITKQLSVTKYTSFVFTFTYLNFIFDKKIAWLLIITNIISNIILIIFIKPNSSILPNKKKTSFFNCIINSISKNINTLIIILGTIIFFNTLPINLINNIYIKSFILSLLEITTSLNNLSTCNLPFNIKLLFTIISLSTCGLCIESQIKSIISDTKYNYRQYLFYRMFHLALFLSLNLLILILFL